MQSTLPPYGAVGAMPAAPAPGGLTDMSAVLSKDGAGESSRGSRAAVVGIVVLAHIAGGWGLMQVDSVRQAVIDAAPIMVDLIAPPPPPPPKPPPPAPKPPPPPPAPVPPKIVKKPPPPPPLITSAPTPAPAPFVAPPPPIQQAPVPEVAVAPTPPAPVQAPPAPPAPPAEPKTVSASAVSYLVLPAPQFPAASRRMNESGRVVVRTLIDKQGNPASVTVEHGSTFKRLDDAAVAAVRAARFKPYTENGSPLAVWVLIPIDFSLEN
ncbi:MAG: tonB [Rhizobacter sp.]|nr:tonB [Rhizobacter sp.]